VTRAPKMWRKKGAGGRLVGSYYARVNGKEIKLGTSDGDEATKRLRAALKSGKRNFTDEMDEAAAAVDGPPPAPPPPLPFTQGDPGSGGAHTPATGGSTPPPATPLQPDGYIPPPAAPLQLPAPSADDARAEAEATNAAAADVGAGGAGSANDNAVPPISGDVLEAMVENGALVIVDLQLQLQAYIIKRKLGRVAGEIAPDSPLRKAAAQAWVAQLKIWIPDFDFLPPWGLALLLPVVCVPQQLATSQPIPKEDQQEKPAETPAQEAA
jgi:hypothetical protein